MELPAPAAGTITEILAQDGETVTVGQVIGRMSVGAGAAAPAPAAAPQPAAAETGASVVVDSRGWWRRCRQRLADRPPCRSQPGRRPRRGSRHARGGRITKADVLAAAGNGATATPPSGSAARGSGHQTAQGRRGRAGPLHGREPLDPHRDVVPHADGHRARRAPQAAQERRLPRVLHPPDRLRDRPHGHGRHAGHGPPFRRNRRQAEPRRRRRRQSRTGRRRREEGRVADADGAR